MTSLDATMTETNSLPNVCQAVSVTSGGGDPGSTYLMERKLAGGRAQNELEILDRDRLTELAILTTEAAPEEVSTIAT